MRRDHGDEDERERRAREGNGPAVDDSQQDEVRRAPLRSVRDKMYRERKAAIKVGQ